MEKFHPHPSLAIVSRQSSITKRILLGIASYVRIQEKWALCPFELEEESLSQKIQDQCIGTIIIDNGEFDEEEKLRITHSIPTVVIGGEATKTLPGVLHTDDHAIAMIAANTFLDRGFQSLGFAGAMAYAEIRARYQSYVSALEKYQISPFVFSSNYHLGSMRSIKKKEDIPTRKRLMEWVANLPNPIGIFAADDVIAFEVYQAASRIGKRIPEELALLGVNDDEFLCRITNPSMSSIRLPFERMGYDAAKLISKIIKHGGNSPHKGFLYQPIGLIARDSIKTVVVQDEIVRGALMFIQENYMNLINVEDILHELGVSRSLLERRFREQMGVTPLVELRRYRIEKARALLSDTNESIHDMGKRCGFASAIRFTTVFKEQVGMTPTEFRKRMLPVIRN